MAPTSGRWAVGKVLGPRGLRGELKLRLFRASPAYLAAGRVLLGDTPYTIRRVAWADPHTPVVSLDGLADRTAAEALAGAPVSLEPSWFAPGAGPVEQLLGARAVDDETGRPLPWSVAGIDSNGAQDLLVLRDEAGLERLVPYVDALVPAVEGDGAGGVRVRLRPIPGLLDDAE